jgi:hypothetical protein
MHYLEEIKNKIFPLSCLSSSTSTIMSMWMQIRKGTAHKAHYN